MPKSQKLIPDFVIFGVALFSVTALVVFLIFFMQEPNAPVSTNIEHEIVRLPEELSADFKYAEGCWTANGPAGDESVRRLVRKHKNISAVCLNQAGITAKGLDALQGHGVRSLDIINLDMNVEMARSLSRFESLRELLLKDQTVTDEVFKALTGPATLESLLLKNSRAGKAGFENLRLRLPNLKSLSLINCKNINDSVVPELSQCSKLQSLNIISTPLSADAMLTLVDRLPLKCLSFENQNDTDLLVRKLETSKLKELNLVGSSLSVQALSNLAKLNTLKRLNLIDCQNLSKAQISELTKKLPECKIRTGGYEGAPELGLVE